jgi:alkyl hydroperoxide reductase subunit AhpC
MATLVLPEPQTQPSSTLPAAPRLRSWLDGDWAILFSHPDDFVGCDLEADRWLTIVQRKFADHGVRPLALATPSRQLDCGWVAQISGNPGAVMLCDPVERVDLQARRLHEEVVGTQRRFVMIIDRTLYRRRTYSYVNPAYGDPARLPSPLDFVGWVKSLRGSSSAADRYTIERRPRRLILVDEIAA